MIPSRGLVMAGRVLMVAFSLLVWAYVPALTGQPHPLSYRTALLALVAVFTLAWAWFWLRLAGSDDGRRAALAVAVVTAATIPLTAIAPPGYSTFVFAAGMAGVAFPLRTGLLVTLLMALLQVAIRTARHDPLDILVGSGLNTLFVGGIAAGGRLLIQSNVRLAEAREEVARLAVSEERLRFARDLHDQIGQNLTMIVLKSELLARSLGAETGEPARLQAREVAEIARRALREVRETVTAYRQPALTEELAGARTALQAAGIGLAVEDTLGPMPAAQERVLAWTVREGVTNVLRHSRASRCLVRLHHERGSAVLEIEDDGVGAGPGGAGSGLEGIRERVAAVGGTFRAGAAGAGFRLQVAVPLLET
jgi:two-component system, NarL family, sensor histidine kinase DesK